MHYILWLGKMKESISKNITVNVILHLLSSFSKLLDSFLNAFFYLCLVPSKRDNTDGDRRVVYFSSLYFLQLAHRAICKVEERLKKERWCWTGRLRQTKRKIPNVKGEQGECCQIEKTEAETLSGRWESNPGLQLQRSTQRWLYPEAATTALLRDSLLFRNSGCL